MGFFRLFLAWMVVVCHTAGYENMFQVDIGTIAVATFFFISGFLMPLTYETHYQKQGIRGACFFYINRALKIYPIYWVSLLLMVGMLLGSDILHKTIRINLIEVKTYIQNILLIGINQSFLWGGYIRLNNPSWTLDVELQYYILTPVLLYIINAKKLLGAMIFFALSVISLYLFFQPMNLVDVDRSFISWSIFFLAGFVFYKSHALIFWRYGFFIVAVVTLSVIFGLCGDGSIQTFSITLLFICLSSFLLLKQKEYKFGPLDRLLGDLSYPTYILHIIFFGPAIKILKFTQVSSLSSGAEFLITSLVHIIVSTGVGYLALRYISEPLEGLRMRVRDSWASI
jgi:peptidoglycan/LPS O-acetylase OafA/YrhL